MHDFTNVTTAEIEARVQEIENYGAFPVIDWCDCDDEYDEDTRISTCAWNDIDRLEAELLLREMSLTR